MRVEGFSVAIVVAASLLAAACKSEHPACETDKDCREKEVCVDRKCQQCRDSADCAQGQTCTAGKCTPTAGREDCVGGLCASGHAGNAPAPCELPAVLFDFNEAILTTEATHRLDTALECLKSRDAVVRAVGHADPRGTEEYNLALSERRARSVRDHLEQSGIDARKINLLPRGSLDARGTDDAGWANDRRVELTWQ